VVVENSDLRQAPLIINGTISSKYIPFMMINRLHTNLIQESQEIELIFKTVVYRFAENPKSMARDEEGPVKIAKSALGMELFCEK